MRLTAREKEILEYLKKDLLISQDDLARHMGISRSSVGVHISNLIKKGIILGKGYVINEKVSVVLYGESYLAVDIQEHKEGCSIDIAYRGVCCEVGDILTRFGLDIKAVTIVGNDQTGDEILDFLQKKGIDTKSVLRLPRSRSCRRVYINGEKAYEEGLGLEAYNQLLDSQDWLIFNCEWLLIEPAFNNSVLDKMSGREENKLPFLATWFLFDEIAEIPDYLSKYSLIVWGINDVNKMEDLKNMALKAVDCTRCSIILTDGNSKVTYFENGKFSDFSLLPAQKFSCHNRLSTLTAALVYGIASEYPLRQAVRIAVGTASAN